VQAFSAPAQRADSRPSLEAAFGNEAAADAEPRASDPLQIVSETGARPATATNAALAPPAAETMHRDGGSSQMAATRKGQAGTSMATPTAAGSGGHPAAVAAGVTAESGTSPGVAAARRRPAVHFAPGDAVSGGSPAADSPNRSRDNDGLEAPEALEGMPQGAEASGASASSGGSLPEFPEFPVAGCADMAARAHRLDDDPAEPPGGDVHTTALGEPWQHHGNVPPQALAVRLDPQTLQPSGHCRSGHRDTCFRCLSVVHVSTAV
jgi:hypothetical protein